MILNSLQNGLKVDDNIFVLNPDSKKTTIPRIIAFVNNAKTIGLKSKNFFCKITPIGKIIELAKIKIIPIPVLPSLKSPIVAYTTAVMQAKRDNAVILLKSFSFNIIFPKKHIHNGTNNIINAPVLTGVVCRPVLYNIMSAEYNMANNKITSKFFVICLDLTNEIRYLIYLYNTL